MRHRPRFLYVVLILLLAITGCSNDATKAQSESPKPAKNPSETTPDTTIDDNEFETAPPDPVTKNEADEPADSPAPNADPELTTVNELRSWTDATGKFKTEAQFIDFEDGTVHLKKTNGKVIEIPLARLSAEDQHFLTLHVPDLSTTDAPNDDASVWLIEDATAKHVFSHSIPTFPATTLTAPSGSRFVQVECKVTALVADPAAAATRAADSNYKKDADGKYRNIYTNDEIVLDGQYRILDMNDVALVTEGGEEFTATWVAKPNASYIMTPQGQVLSTTREDQHWNLTAQTFAGKKPTKRFIGLLEAKQPVPLVALFAVPSTQSIEQLRIKIKGGETVPVKLQDA